MVNSKLLRFGEKIRKLRLAKNMSQEKLADTAGLDRSYVGGVERGERNLSLLNILKISKGLGIPASRLLEGLRNGAES